MPQQKIVQTIFQLILTVTLFSYWAGFALLVINKLFYQDLPGYRIGRICLWEFVAIIVAGIIAQGMIKRWGNIKLEQVDHKWALRMNPKFGIYFAVYFLILVLVAVWQFWLFSQQF